MPLSVTSHKVDSVAMNALYFDNNATTPLDRRVAEAMRPWMWEEHGNPASIHQFGRAAREAVEVARTAVARLIGAAAPEIVFNSSGTEAMNAVFWSVGSIAEFKGHVIFSAFEHPAAQASADRLESFGMEVTRIPPGNDGVVPAEAVIAALRPDTKLVSLMLANNELGTLQPVSKVAATCRPLGVPVLTDAVQAVGKVAVDVEQLGVDFLILGGHKFHGPVGSAALWIRKGTPFESWMIGGSQERHRRSGTLNVPAIVGLGRAAELALEELPHRIRQLGAIRDRFEAGLSRIPDARIHCRDAPRLPHTSHIAFLGAEGESLTIRLDLAGYAVSTGAACSSGVVEPSRTLLAIGLSAAEALASIRVSFGITNHEEEVDPFLAVLSESVAALRAVAPLASTSTSAVD